MPQFDIFGNKILVTIFAMYFFLLYLSFVVLINSIKKVVHFTKQLKVHIYLCKAHLYLDMFRVYRYKRFTLSESI